MFFVGLQVAYIQNISSNTHFARTNDVLWTVDPNSWSRHGFASSTPCARRRRRRRQVRRGEALRPTGRLISGYHCTRRRRECAWMKPWVEGILCCYNCLLLSSLSLLIVGDSVSRVSTPSSPEELVSNPLNTLDVSWLLLESFLVKIRYYFILMLIIEKF